ncbi:MAG: IS982 family transposase [Ilumatobacteraceae bacterium]
MDADLDTLATALYARIDDTLKARPQLQPWRPKVGIAPKLSDAELLTLAVMQALLGFAAEARWLRHARAHLTHLFPYLPGQAGYNKRLRRSATQLQAMIRLLAEDTDVWSDDTWLIDSTPVESSRSVPTTKRSRLAGWAGYGYCASHSRFFWGLRLHLVCTPAGLPITFALTNPKADERDVAIDMFDHDPTLLAGRHGQTIIADKGYVSGEFERALHDRGVELIRPARKDERPRRGARQLKPLRQIIESVNDTLKGQLSLEQHGGHSPQGVTVRILQRLLALTAAIWHNHHSRQPVLRSLVAYDH